MAGVAVLTGGSSGIGAAVSTRLLAAGRAVHVLDVVPPSGTDLEYVNCDLGVVEAIDAAVARLPAQIETLIHVAGIPPGPHPSEAVLAVNFLGMRHLTSALLPHIVRGGSIVVVASSAGWDWRERRAVVDELLDTPSFAAGCDWARRNGELWQSNPYKFSKQCAAAYTYRAAGDALPHGVRVNCVNPGITETRLTPVFRDYVGADTYDSIITRIGRSGTPDDMAEVIEFLAIGPSRWLNGVEVVVDGGYIAGLVGGWIDA